MTQSDIMSGAVPFEGEVTVEHMASLRSAAMNLTAKRHGMQQTQVRLHEVRTIDDIWFWLQRGFVPAVYAEQRKKGPLDITSVFPTDGVTYNAKGETTALS